MKLLLSVPEGKPIGRSLLYEILGLGFHGVRVDVPDDHGAAEAMLEELARMPEVYPIFLIAGGHMLRSTGKPFEPGELAAHVSDTCVKLRDFGFFKRDALPAIEIGNEPDLADDRWKKRPEELARTFQGCYDIVRRYSDTCPVLTPPVSNLNGRGFHYLERMLREGLPFDAVLAAHRYPHDGDICKPHPGFNTREEQASKLVELADGRDIWITETGLTEGPHDGKFRSEEYVADALEYEVSFWSRVASVKALCWYGINDGPNRDDTEHHFGIRRLDGSWKPVAQRVARVRAAMEAA